MNQSLGGPLIVLATIAISDAWVVRDSVRHRARGHDVAVAIGPLSLDRPEHWLLACLVAWPIAFPMYLVARRES